jgi:hypothetical protein
MQLQVRNASAYGATPLPSPPSTGCRRALDHLRLEPATLHYTTLLMLFPYW